MATTQTRLITTPSALSKESKVNHGYVLIDEKDRPKVAHNDFSDDVPAISIAGIDEDYPGGRRSAILRNVVAAAEEWGIFQVVDHDIDPQLTSRLSELSKEFFALPDEEKLHYRGFPGSKGGFIVSSHLQGEAIGNWREFMIFFTHPINGRDYSRWPDKPKEWRAMVDAYAEKQMDLALKLIEMLSESLGVDRDALTKSLVEPAQHLVINHYPKCPQPELAMGLKRHTDPSCVTLLWQDDVGGLQATKDDGKTWITVRPIKNALVIILGEHMKFMSNGRFKSADHQAIVNSKETRMTLAAFINPDDGAIVYPLSLKEGEKSLLEEPIVYTEMRKRHYDKYLEIVRLKKLAKEENCLKN